MSKGPRILIWDIESAGVNARNSDLGWVLCISYKWLGEKKVHTLKVTDFPRFRRNPHDDKDVLRNFLKVTEEADMLVAHYGNYFDLPFFKGRLVMQDLPPLPPIPQIDTCKECWKHFKFSSNRLKNLAKRLGLKQQKAENDWPDWWHNAMLGHRKSIDKMAKYCEQDVRTLEAVFLKLKPFIKSMGRWQFHKDGLHCPKCGSQRTNKRGFNFTGAGKYQRYQCRDCGGWFSDKKNIVRTSVKDL